MNILYIAYSCSPNHGSEDRIGWKIPLASAANHRVFVLTKEEHRSEIEEFTTMRFCTRRCVMMFLDWMLNSPEYFGDA